jgi:DNA-binding NarL/FixJ family response regulator
VKLKAKDQELIRYLLEGMGNREIGQRMGTLEQTAKNRLREVCDKTGAGSRTELVLMVMAHPEWIGAEKCPACGGMKGER